MAHEFYCDIIKNKNFIMIYNNKTYNNTNILLYNNTAHIIIRGSVYALHESFPRELHTKFWLKIRYFYLKIKTRPRIYNICFSNHLYFFLEKMDFFQFFLRKNIKHEQEMKTHFCQREFFAQCYPFLPTVAFLQSILAHRSNIFRPRDWRPLRDDSALRLLSSLRGLRGAPRTF